MVVLLEVQLGETQDRLEKIRNTRLAVIKLEINVIYFGLIWDGMVWLFLPEIKTRTTGIGSSNKALEAVDGGPLGRISSGRRARRGKCEGPLCAPSKNMILIRSLPFAEFAIFALFFSTM